MACYHPLTLKPDPKRVGQSHTVPCGRCIGCKLERSRQWAVRGMHEASLQYENCFLTLTVRDSNYLPQEIDDYCAHQDMCTKSKSADEFSTAAEVAPTIPTGGVARNAAVDNSPARTVRVPYAAGTRDRPSVACQEGRGESLSIRDHQLFMKKLLRRLRDQGPIRPIRFMMCGEYGEQLGRPHYHYILFGYNFPDRKKWAKRNGHQSYRSSLLEEIWPHGHAEIGEANFETIAYVARYVTKKITGAAADEHYKRSFHDGTEYWLQPEFNAMSRAQGIGKKWIQKYKDSVYPHDRVVINQRAAKPPRYYDQQLDEAALLEIKNARQRKINPANNSPERLRAGEAIQHAALKKAYRPLEKRK